MLTDREKHSSCKSLRSSSLVSSLFESATSIIHPLERLEPTNVDVDIQIDSTKATPEHPSTSESIQLTHFGRTGLSSIHTANVRLDERNSSDIVVGGGLVAQKQQQQQPQQQQQQSPAQQSDRWEFPTQFVVPTWEYQHRIVDLRMSSLNPKKQKI